jgi:hypothetical protein
MKCIGIAAATRGSALLKAGADFVLPDFTDLKLSDLFELFQPPGVVEQQFSFLPELTPLRSYP